MKSVKKLLIDKDSFTKDMADRHKYVTKEYQDYGYRIAIKLGEEKRASLFIKLAKDKPRALIDQAFSFAIDYPNAKNRGSLFMWKLKELQDEADIKSGKVKDSTSVTKSSKKKSKTNKKKKAERSGSSKDTKQSDKIPKSRKLKKNDIKKVDNKGKRTKKRKKNRKVAEDQILLPNDFLSEGTDGK